MMVDPNGLADGLVCGNTPTGIRPNPPKSHGFLMGRLRVCLIPLPHLKRGKPIGRKYNGEFRELNEFFIRPRVCKTLLPVTVGRDLRQRRDLRQIRDLRQHTDRQHTGRHTAPLRGCRSATALQPPTKKRRPSKMKVAFCVKVVRRLPSGYSTLRTKRTETP